MRCVGCVPRWGSHSRRLDFSFFLRRLHSIAAPFEAFFQPLTAAAIVTAFPATSLPTAASAALAASAVAAAAITVAAAALAAAAAPSLRLHRQHGAELPPLRRDGRRLVPPGRLHGQPCRHLQSFGDLR